MAQGGGSAAAQAPNALHAVRGRCSCVPGLSSPPPPGVPAARRRHQPQLVVGCGFEGVTTPHNLGNSLCYPLTTAPLPLQQPAHPQTPRTPIPTHPRRCIQAFSLEVEELQLQAWGSTAQEMYSCGLGEPLRARQAASVQRRRKCTPLHRGRAATAWFGNVPMALPGGPCACTAGAQWLQGPAPFSPVAWALAASLRAGAWLCHADVFDVHTDSAEAHMQAVLTMPPPL